MCMCVCVCVGVNFAEEDGLFNEGGSGLMGPYVETFFTERDGSGQCISRNLGERRVIWYKGLDERHRRSIKSRNKYDLRPWDSGRRDRLSLRIS